MESRRTLTIAIAALATILFWASAFAGIRAGLRSYTPVHLALLRYLTASAVLAVYAAATRMKLPALRDVPLILLLGFLGFAFYNIALNIGEQSVAAGPAAVLIQTGPIWTALAAAVFLHERLAPMGWIGTVVSFAGAILIGVGKGGSFHLGWSAALILSAAISMSAYNIIAKRMLNRYTPVQLTTYGIWAGTLMMLPFASGLLGQIRAAALGDTIAVVYMGVCPAALGYITWAIVLSRLPASRASSFLYAIPVVAFIIGWAWLGEVPTGIDVAGGALAIGGVIVVNTLGRAREARSTPR